MTWTLGIAIAALVVGIINFIIIMAVDDGMTKTHNDYSIRLSKLERWRKKVRNG